MKNDDFMKKNSSYITLICVSMMLTSMGTLMHSDNRVLSYVLLLVSIVILVVAVTKAFISYSKKKK